MPACPPARPLLWLLLTLPLLGACDPAEAERGQVRLQGAADETVDGNADLPIAPPFSAPVSTPLDISSTFGPRWKYSDSRDDFHRGIDYYGAVGDPVYAIGDGTVSSVYAEGSSAYPNGGNVLVIRFDLPQSFAWQGSTVDRVYGVYLHLDSVAVAEGDAVTEGQTVAGMGETGDTTFVHLHFETRLQTVCSLEYQLNNPEAACADYGFDPHVHPYALVGGENADGGGLSHSSGPPFTVTWQAERGDLDLNVLDSDLGTLNFNRRTGFDASSTDTLDDFDRGWVRVVPGEFLSTSDSIRYDFEFSEQPAWVELRDLWGHGIRRTFLD